MKKRLTAALLAAALALSGLSGCVPKLPLPAQKSQSELSPENTSMTTAEGVTVYVGDFLLDGPEKLTVSKQEAQVNTEEGYKVDAYDIQLGNMTELEDFITIRIPYDSSICEEGEDPAECVAAMYYNESTGLWEDVLFTVDTEAQELEIYTNHLSTFGAFAFENAGKRHAKVTEILDPSYLLGPEQAWELAEQVAGGDGIAKKALRQVGASAVHLSETLQNLEPLKNILYPLEEAPPWISLKIMETNLDMYTVAGGILLARSIIKAAAGEGEGEKIELINEVATNVMVFISKRLLTETAKKSLTVSMSGVYILEKMLEEMGTEAINTRREDIYFVYQHYNEGFKGANRQPKTYKDWRALVMQVLEKHPKDLDRAQAALESAFTKYASEFFDLSPEAMAEVAADTPGVKIKRIPHISSEDQEALTEAYISHLKNNVMPAVMTSAKNYYIKLAEQAQLEVLQKFKNFYNTPIRFVMKEKIPEGGTSRYAGYQFRLAPLSENASLRNWSGTFPANGLVDTASTLAGFVTSGYPHTVEFFPPGADMNTTPPEFVLSFVIDTDGIMIEFGGSPSFDELVGEYPNGTITVTDYYISDALRAQAENTAGSEDALETGCDINTIIQTLEESKGVPQESPFSITKTEENRGAMYISDSPGEVVYNNSAGSLHLSRSDETSSASGDLAASFTGNNTAVQISGELKLTTKLYPAEEFYVLARLEGTKELTQ